MLVGFAASSRTLRQALLFIYKLVSIYMRNLKATIILFVFSVNAYTQEYEDLFYDEQLQILHKDTLQDIGKRLTGEWLYLGNRNKIKNGNLTDSIPNAYHGDEKTTPIIIENGVCLEIEDGERKKADYFYKTTFNFNSELPSSSNDIIYINRDEVLITSCCGHSFPELIYYKNSFGILYDSSRPAYELDIISVLTDQKLIFKDGKEYEKLE
jgi:hypothetical protein